jgi:acetyl-CoA carboxylase alpha subunit
VDLDRLFDRRIPLAGDRKYGEDPAVRAGIGWVRGQRCVFVAAEVGPSTPAAYAKAARMLALAATTGAPCVLVGAMPTAHLARASDGRDAGALDEYVRALATSNVHAVALLDTDAHVDITDAFDHVVVASEHDAGEVAAAVALALAVDS